jgi:DNA polymerase-3 subunit epsilon
MRLVVIDTETTGLSPKNGDKMVEIGAIAIEHGQVQVDQTFHRFIDPQCAIPDEVVEIHGIDAAKLAEEGARPFAEIGAEFLDFIAGATLVFHNASFDLGFIKKELSDAGLPGIDAMPVIDTLSMARQCFPKQPNHLDALCDRFAIDRSHRALHGALIDATLTALCFLAMSDSDSVAEESSTLPTQQISELMLELYSELEQRHKQAMSEPLTTGIAALDEKHCGIQAGDLILIAGEADSGKTTLATEIVHQLAFRDFNPCSVLIFSLRQPAIQWAEQALGREAKVDASSMQSEESGDSLPFVAI